MRCCWPGINNDDSTNPLLSSDLTNVDEQSATIVLDELRTLLRALNSQANVSWRRDVEERKRMEKCIVENNRIGARHHLVESKKLIRKYGIQLQTVSNLKDVIGQLEAALANLELVKKLSGAALSLKQLVDATPDPTQLMDQIRECMTMINGTSESMKMQSQPNLDDEDIDAELAQLMIANMPNVPLQLVGWRDNQQQQQQRQHAE